MTECKACVWGNNDYEQLSDDVTESKPTFISVVGGWSNA